MKISLALAVAAASCLVQADVVYVTDLSIYTMLAPCAQIALSYNIMDRTLEQCPSAVTALQSCVCSQSADRSSVASSISSSVSNFCAATASDDQTSASSVFSVYCNQADAAAAAATFPAPSPAVTQFITDIPELGFLAKCASEQLASQVQGLTMSLCPKDAADLATCACQKNQNSLMLSESINTWVSIDCESNTADIASAQAFFSAYCNLNNGTSSFPSASFPPGDMSYYISDMPQYNSLDVCARSAVFSAIHSTASYFCPTGGPQLLASCACIKPRVSSMVSVFITDAVEQHCSEGDTGNLSSGLAVFAQYCSAARGEVVEAGITASVAQTLPFGMPAASTGAGSGGSLPTTTAAPTQTATATATTTTTATSGSSSSSGSSGSSSPASGGGKKSGASTGTIVGAAVGSVAGVALVVAAAFFAWRHARASRARQSASEFHNLDSLAPGAGGAAGGFTKAELGGTPLSSTSAVVSPIAPAKATPELADNQMRPAQELSGSAPRAEMPADMSFQSGPVPELYAEMDGSDRRT